MRTSLNLLLEVSKMKNVLFLVLIFFVFACKEKQTTQPVIQKNCPLPVQFTDPNADPIYRQYAFKLSPDGSKLFFSLNSVGVKILDLKTLSVSQFDIRPLLPKNTQLGGIIPVLFCCPYNPNNFVCVVHLGVDTIGDGKKFPGGDHLIICSFDGTYYEDITPKVFNPIGSKLPIALEGWYPFSTPGNDKFLIGYRLVEHGHHYYGFYNPLTQDFQEVVYKGLSAYTNDWKYQYFVNYDSVNKSQLRYYLNDNELIFKDIEYLNTGSATFSPNGKLFALGADVWNTQTLDSTTRLAEIWIIDVEKFMTNPVQPVPVKIINIKDKLCMFSFGLRPVFTSDSTIAVSLFKNGDASELLYEIDLDGNLVRQLTFSP